MSSPSNCTVHKCLYLEPLPSHDRGGDCAIQSCQQVQEAYTTLSVVLDVDNFDVVLLSFNFRLMERQGYFHLCIQYI